MRDYRPSDLRQVVEIDQAALKGFMMTRLGGKFMSQYYSLIDSYPRKIFLVAEGYGGLTGFSAGYVWPSEFNAHIAAAGPRLMLAALPALLRRPLAASNLARETRQAEGVEWADAPIDPARCELAAIAVRPQFTRRGIGRRLVGAFAQRAAQMGATEIRLTTTGPDGDPAAYFYRSLGFELARVLGSGRHRAKEYRLPRLIP